MSFIQKLRDARLVRKATGGYMIEFKRGLSLDLPEQGETLLAGQRGADGVLRASGDSRTAITRAAGLGRSDSRRGARIFFNRHSVRANAGAGRTHLMVVEAPCDFDQIGLIVANTQGAQTVEVQASVCAMADLSNINNSVNDGRWSALVNWKTNNGNSSVGLCPVSPGQVNGRDRKSYIASIPANIRSAAKLDGKKGAYAGIRLYTRAASPTYTVMGNGTTDLLSQWAARPSGKGTMIMRSQDGQFVVTGTAGAAYADSTIGGFNSVVNENTSPIVGIVFLARGRVVSMVIDGDSLADGRDNPIGSGYLHGMCEQASDADVTFVASNLGSPGQAGAVYIEDLRDLLASEIGQYFDGVVYHTGSPNDITTTIGQVDIQNMRARTNDAKDFCYRAGKAFFPVTWAPSNTAVKNYITSGGENTDLLRIAHNNYVRSLGMPVIDIDKILAGAAGAGGQIQLKAEYNLDNIHQNKAADDAIATAYAPQLKLMK